MNFRWNLWGAILAVAVVLTLSMRQHAVAMWSLSGQPASATALMAAAGMGTQGNPDATPDEEEVIRLRAERDRLTKTIVLIVVGALCVISLYFWTYGKWHHRLPRI